jgi:hypothetical protein
MKQQTAVEWLVSQLHLVMTGQVEAATVFEQAKEHEKQQLIQLIHRVARRLLSAENPTEEELRRYAESFYQKAFVHNEEE